MFDLGKFGATIDLDSSKFNKGMKTAEDKANTFSGKLGKFAKVAGGLAVGAVVGLATATTGAFVATKKVAEGFDEIAKNSTKLGVSTDAYQELDYWAGQNGISTENMEKAVGRLNQRIGDAKNGNEKYSGALEALGVNMDDVRDGTVSTEDAMYQSISALSEMTNEQDKAALASELFGTKLGRELMPALQDGSLSLEDAKKKAEELGIVIDGDTLSAAEKFNDTWDDLTTSLQVFGQKVIAELMPTFQSMMDWVIAHMPQIQATFTTVFDAIGTAISSVKDWIGIAIDWFQQMYEKVTESVGGMGDVFDNFKPFIDRFKESIETFVNGVEPVWENLKGLFESLTPILELVGVIIGGVLITALGVILGFYNGVLNAGAPFYNAIINAIDFVVNIINALIAILIGDFSGAWDYLVIAGESAIDFFINGFTAIYEFIAGFVTGVIDFFHGLYMTLVGNSIIPDMVNAIVEWFVNLKDWVIEKVMEFVNGVIEWFVNLYESTIETISIMIDFVISKFIQMKEKTQEIMNIFLDIIKSIWSYIENTFQNALDFLLALVTLDFQGMKDAMQNQMDNAKNLLSNIWSSIKQLIGAKASEILTNIISKFVDIKNNMQNKINEAKDKVVSYFTDLVSNIKTKASDIVNTVRDKFNDAKNKITKPIEDAKDTVSGIIDDIKGFFTNLKLKIPKPSMPKMPSFSLKTSSKSVMGKSISYPSGIGVNWNAKGGIFKRPTIFNTANAGMQGVGEVSGESEAILPLNSSTLGGIGKGIANTMSSSSDKESNELLKEQNKLLRRIASKDTNVYMNGRDVTEAVDDIQSTDFLMANIMAGNK